MARKMPATPARRRRLGRRPAARPAAPAAASAGALALVIATAGGWPGAAAQNVLMDEKTVLETCIRDHGDAGRCRCYLGVIKAEAGPELYEATVAYVAATFSGDAKAVDRVRQRFDLTAEREQAMVERLRAASATASEVCEAAARRQSGRDGGSR
ncbi:hypothetical protein EV659_102375 [Rhodothalassium salexigens DSM 2132]|uniref:Uncharacterized protein n=1 Tax=Rhodothalassium salexigens DSM 2132 TaxID=1188247 RepID=A0A4R2PS99_RHOSA|nr:hypothetical protein [Rhodothalassium salexigens]MBB4210479.1 hypothetical protein [Rhodothalassium salexigens DSM 2132]MBK1639452.1 hypothetical protein [Rhodothalassium salexigens DSM 2132]TCP37964.1 hypothetical protein EV659_102375 [Rhodothalassium salexigens DSM 2132]